MLRLRTAVIQARRRCACGRAFHQMPALPGVQPSEARSKPTPAAARPRWKGPLVWLFIPPIDLTIFAASAFAPASEDLTLAFTSQNPDIALFVMSSETVSPQPLSWRGWRTRPWLRLLSGTICDPLTAALGANAFISSLPAIPANRSRLRATGGARTIRATCGPRSPGSSAKSAPNGASSKTSPAICPLVCKTSPETFKAWATALQRASYQRRKLAHPTCATVCSFWPTPTFKSSGNTVCLIPNPAGLKMTKDERQGGKQKGLKNAVYSWTVLWDLLMAMGWTPRSPASSLPYRVHLRSGEIGSQIGQTE